jgi:hypothetical protein
MHPDEPRCSSVEYRRCSPSSRLVRQAPRSSRSNTGLAPRTASAGFPEIAGHSAAAASRPSLNPTLGPTIIGPYGIQNSTIVTPWFRGSTRKPRTAEIAWSRACNADLMRPPLRPWIRRRTRASDNSATLIARSARSSASATVSPCRSTSGSARGWDCSEEGPDEEPDRSGETLLAREGRGRSTAVTSRSVNSRARAFTSTRRRPLLRTARTTPLPKGVCTNWPEMKGRATW